MNCYKLNYLNLLFAVKRFHYVSSIPECVVCLQPCYHPVKLKCDHIFCFLCVKGVAARSHRCALCRAEVHDNYFESPIVVSNYIHLFEMRENTGNKVCRCWHLEGCGLGLEKIILESLGRIRAIIDSLAFTIMKLSKYDQT